MDVTLLYNGYNLERRKMFVQSPRNNLNSQIVINWQDSLHHDELSPLSKMKQKRTLQNNRLKESYSNYVDSYLDRELHLHDSGIRRTKNVQRSLGKTQFENHQTVPTMDASQYGKTQNNESRIPKLPKIGSEDSSKRKSQLSQFVIDKSKGYLHKILRDRLKKYDTPSNQIESKEQ